MEKLYAVQMLHIHWVSAKRYWDFVSAALPYGEALKELQYVGDKESVGLDRIRLVEVKKVKGERIFELVVIRVMPLRLVAMIVNTEEA